MVDAVTIWKPVKPEGLARPILVVTIRMTITCLVIFGLRLWARIRTAMFVAEDYLMCVGVIRFCAKILGTRSNVDLDKQTLNMVHNAMVIYGCYTGVGSPDARSSTGNMMEGAKAVLLWQLFYVTGSIFIKWSICTTLMRIAIQRKYIYILWGLVVVNIVVNTVAFGAVLARCRPIEAAWNPSLGTCLDQHIIVTLTYVVSGVNVFLDWSVAIIPVFILWDIQMRRKLKFITGGILGIGVLASVATIIRILYSDAYNETVNQLHDIGNRILWTIIECGLGIIAGSLPMLRSLIKGLAKDTSSNNDRYRRFTPSGGTDLITFGRIGNHRTNPGRSNVFTTIAAKGDSNEELDSDSTRNIITVTHEYDLSRADRDDKEIELNRLGINCWCGVYNPAR